LHYRKELFNIEDISTMKRKKGSEAPKIVRVPSFTIRKIEHTMTIIDADQGIAEIEDDIFNRVSDFLENRDSQLVN
jgi:hypothetical protein